MTPERLPPYSEEAEKSILGCVFFDGNRAVDLKLEWFYVLNHRMIAEAAIHLALNGGPVDPYTVAQRLQFQDAPKLVSECANSMAGGFDWWADILKGYATVRAIIKTSMETVCACYEPMAADNADTILDRFEQAALGIREEAHNKGCNASDLKTCLIEVIEEWREAAEHQKPRGLETGFSQLDAVLGGMKPQELFIVAARPSVGKTSLAMNIADHLAVDNGIPVGVFSLEMSAKELIARLTCSRAEVDLGIMNAGHGTERELSRISGQMDKIRKSPLHIVDKGGLTLPRLASASRRLVQRHKIRTDSTPIGGAGQDFFPPWRNPRVLLNWFFIPTALPMSTPKV